ncbi:hypothetical protein [Agriterribacter sp.]|uniref:hypothetical protein n=1 Tax=Agriterribacter sp. TaxID=2821509 RepID=UPI002BB15EA6|nr:hypothetical protein [Agriterribacter sp.]HRO44440.1 hypothetical protein [Agriterribacter sp.]HRQ16533.1 hypothetical protein [Agriterribacter sp.]
MIQHLRKHKRTIAYFLLLGFLNIMTFLPVSLMEDSSANMDYPVFKSGEWTAMYEQEDNAPATILELLLEDIAGLKDRLPDHEKPGFNAHFFNSKNRVSVCFFQSFIIPPAIPEVQPMLIAKHDFPEASHASKLPHLQHHNFIFRLTPF